MSETKNRSLVAAISVLVLIIGNAEFFHLPLWLNWTLAAVVFFYVLEMVIADAVLRALRTWENGRLDDFDSHLETIGESISSVAINVATRQRHS